AQQGAAGENELRQRLQPSRRYRASAVCDTLAAFEEGADGGVGLEALELFVRREVRILIAQADHEPNGDLVVFLVIQEGAAIGSGGERPAGGVHDKAGPVPLRLHVPQLLQPDAVYLRRCSELESLLELTAELAAAALGEEGVLAVQLHARLVRGGLFALLA